MGEVCRANRVEHRHSPKVWRQLDKDHVEEE